MARTLLTLLFVPLLFGCSTLKGWFTPQGQRLQQAQSLSDAGHPLGASALAVEALVIEPSYEEALRLLERSFAPGQAEFRSSVERWEASTAPERWDRLYELYTWQETLARDGARVSELYAVASVAEPLARAAREASLHHWQKAQELEAVAPGPRQARKALVEGRLASRLDAQTPGLADWLSQATERATQRLLVIPFFWEGGGSAPALSGPLGSRVSAKLIEESGLPELTQIFPSDRLVTLPGGGLARLGLISQPDALKLADEAGQNLVLMGQVTRARYQAPQQASTASTRTRRVVLVDPDHPQGVEKVYQATVTSTVWSTQVNLTASYSVIEVATGRDLLTAIREARASDQTTFTTFKGDREALTPDDLQAVATKVPLAEADELWYKALDSLSSQIAQSVRDALKP